ncbi:MAG: (5-formylfuran-3-yl)methyl phosphate synthase [Gemmatimonadales bacterium]
MDTFDKDAGHGLMDYVDLKAIRRFVRLCHASSIEAWVAGSMTLAQLPQIWRTDVDVVCVRGAACVKSDEGRFGQVDGSCPSGTGSVDCSHLVVHRTPS